MKKFSRKNLTVLTALVLLAAVLCCAVFGFPPRRIYTAEGREPANMGNYGGQELEAENYMIHAFWNTDLIAECIVLSETEEMDDPQYKDFFRNYAIYEAKVKDVWQGEYNDKTITFYVNRSSSWPYNLPQKGDRLVIFLNPVNDFCCQYGAGLVFMINPGGRLHAWEAFEDLTVYDGKHLSVLKEDMKKVQDYKDTGAEYHYTLDFL